MSHSIGVVVIGRNEGERLRRCLQSADSSIRPVVYVDSGSTDGSVEYARSAGVLVVSLDLGRPFTAARARNAGAKLLGEQHPEVDLIQFVDGDCELDPHWMDRGMHYLAEHPDTAAVCGRRRERFPEASIYNLLCDLEWNTAPGEVESCGGDALIRVSAYRAVGGYADDLICGEEPEMCLRMRALGWKLARVDAEMTLHDAAMLRFGQWWRRNRRTGYGFAAVSHRHRRRPLRIWAREVRSNWFWGLIVPLMATVPAYFTYGLSLLIGGGYFVLFAKIARHRRRVGDLPRIARRYAFFCVLGKFPQMLGQLRYAVGRLVGREARLIEYKGPASP